MIRTRTIVVLVMLLAGLFWLMPHDGFAQKVTLDLGADSGAPSAAGATGRSPRASSSQLVATLTIIPLAPSILVMVTSFMRIIIVLSFLRSALGLQQTPPNQVLISLALFLYLLHDGARLHRESYNNGIAPLIDQKIGEREALEKTAAPFHAFMMKNVREKDLRLFMDLAPTVKIDKPENTPYQILIPAFMIGECSSVHLKSGFSSIYLSSSSTC